MSAELDGQAEEIAQRLRRLREEHSQYSQKLEALLSKPYVSEDEKIEEVRLKKLKLRLKDQISSLDRVPDYVIPVA